MFLVYEIVQDMYSWPNQDFSEMESTLSVQQVSNFTLYDDGILSALL